METEAGSDSSTGATASPGRDAGAPQLTLLYHYFHPDDVVSARHFSDLAEGLVERGWQVTARPANRICREKCPRLARRESWQGVEIRRVWRPDFKQSSNRGRALNTLWMLGAWAWLALASRRRRQEVMLVGTDPILGVLAALPWKLFRRRSRVAHWCFDLYPDAAIADGMLAPESRLARWLDRLTAAAYRRCDLIIDLGRCMGRRLVAHEPSAAPKTITPWALIEPPTPPTPDPEVRRDLFGDAGLALLYSGSFGRAHSYEEFLALARTLRGSSIAFTFAGRGNRADELKAAVSADDANVGFAGFAPEDELEKRLTACDLHLVSLRPEWTGTVVPSKFFGALAAGRGVIFAGSPDSAIAGWIREHQVGWVLTPETGADVANDLRQLAAAPEALVAMRQRCHDVYHAHFSKRAMIDRWDAELRSLLSR